MKSDKSYIFCIEKKKSLKKRITTYWIQYNRSKKTKMDTIFMNSKNSKTSDLHRLLLNLTVKIDLRRKNESITLSNLSIYYTLKNIKRSINLNEQ